MAHVEVRDLTVVRGDRSAGTGVTALDDVDVFAADGELLVILGPSGSGKSTLLRVIAGLDRPTSGSVWFDGEDVTEIRPYQRGVAMVFQDYALYRHLTAESNIGFPLEIQGVAEPDRRTRARAEAEHVGVDHVLDRFPFQLSAGHRQGVATARALIKEARVTLMDEPLSHLDSKARHSVRVELQRIHREVGGTVIYVTNDQSEAMALGDRLVVLDAGTVQQVGRPEEVYRSPANRMVAGFLGTPSMAFLAAEVVGGDGGLELLLGNDRVHLGERPRLVPWVGRPIEVGVRPEHVTIAGPGTAFNRCLHGKVVSVEDTGTALHALVDVGAPGSRLTARVDESLPRGQSVELEVAVDRVGFFDPATGLAV